MLEITRYPLPLQLGDVPEGISGGWLPVIAGLREDEVIELLKHRWAEFQVPYLQELAAEILSRKLRFLSLDEQGHQWLSFGSPSSPLHLAPPSELPNDLQAKFPFAKIPGLQQFVENFSGLADKDLPPCPWFVPVYESRVVAVDCDYYDWGMIGNWAGSLTLYNTGTGNFIVISPENQCAKWDHDFGWGSTEEDPFKSLNWTMDEMVRAFISYLSLDDSQARDSPFHY